jgi:hypothetical protein
MIRTTHSCYLYGPYDSHNTQLLFYGSYDSHNTRLLFYGPYDSHNTQLLFYGPYDSHNTQLLFYGPMIGTTHSCCLYGPYDLHNTQLLFIWAVWLAQHTAVIYMGRMIGTTHTHFSPTRHYPFCFCNQAKWLSPRPKYPSKYNLQLKNDNKNIYLVFKYNKLSYLIHYIASSLQRTCVTLLGASCACVGTGHHQEICTNLPTFSINFKNKYRGLCTEKSYGVSNSPEVLNRSLCQYAIKLWFA